MKKSRTLKRIVKILLILFLIYYWLGTINWLHLGSATYALTVFSAEEPGNSFWISSNGQFTAELKSDTIIENGKNYEIPYLDVKSVNDEEFEYYIYGMDEYKVELCYPSAEHYFTEGHENEICTLKVKFKKRFWKLYAFKLYGIDKNTFDSSKFGSITFYKQAAP